MTLPTRIRFNNILWWVSNNDAATVWLYVHYFLWFGVIVIVVVVFSGGSLRYCSRRFTHGSKVQILRWATWCIGKVSVWNLNLLLLVFSEDVSYFVHNILVIVLIVNAAQIFCWLDNNIMMEVYRLFFKPRDVVIAARLPFMMVLLLTFVWYLFIFF